MNADDFFVGVGFVVGPIFCTLVFLSPFAALGYGLKYLAERDQIKRQEESAIVIRENQRKIKEAIANQPYVTGTVFKVSTSAESFAKGRLEGKLDGRYSTMLSLGDGYISGHEKGAYDAKSGMGTAIGLNMENGRQIGLYVIDADEKKAFALRPLLKEGTRIRFNKTNIHYSNASSIDYYKEETNFDDNTSVGTKRVDRIQIIK